MKTSLLHGVWTENGVDGGDDNSARTKNVDDDDGNDDDRREIMETSSAHVFIC